MILSIKKLYSILLRIPDPFCLETTKSEKKISPEIRCSDLFNLPIGALWTAVLGEWELDSGGRGSARLPVEKVVLHERFENYVHDIGEFFFLVSPWAVRNFGLLQYRHFYDFGDVMYHCFAYYFIE